MKLTLAWLVLTAMMIAALVIGLRFRAGKHRIYLGWYRNGSLPIAMRNLPVVAPVLVAAFLPILVLSAPVFLSPDTARSLVPPAVLKAIVLAVGAYFFLISAGIIALLYRVPRLLIPRWLREEDAKLNFVQAPATGTDKLLLAFGFACFVLGSIIVAATADYLANG